jgi:outer membrane protein TolC
VLLIQFRTLSDPLIVMSSIPLTLLGAMLGLTLTNYPFGFTAFTGLISLCGIVVRNAIILVDYIKEKLAEGRSLEQAAREAGERRLRPIFLTTMAAAVGVTPMILSRSSLWGPLASVIAVGLISSMFFTLIVVPVLYVLVKSRRGAAPKAVPVAVALALALAGAASPARAETRKITLSEAVQLALKQNTSLSIARARVTEKQQRTATARADYFPQVSNDTTVGALSDKQLVSVPAGALRAIPGLGPFPLQEMTFSQGSTLVTLGNTTAAQPITQLLKIRQGVNAAAADARVSQAELQKAEDDVAFAVHQLYYGLLAARAQSAALAAQIAAGEEGLREAQEAVRSGNTLDVTVLGARASLLKTRQSLLAAQNQISDLNAELDNLMGLPLTTELDLESAGEPAAPLARDEYLRSALDRNPELRAAKETENKARAGVKAARYEYVPNLGAFARHTYQSGVPFLSHSFGTFGFQFTWNAFDWGKRKGVVGEREAQLAQAQANVRRVGDRLAVDIDKAWRKLERTKMMVDVAREALALRQESERISGNQLKAGVVSAAKNAEAAAATRGAEADELQARIAYSLALDEIANIAGTPAPR